MTSAVWRWASGFFMRFLAACFQCLRFGRSWFTMFLLYVLLHWFWVTATMFQVYLFMKYVRHTARDSWTQHLQHRIIWVATSKNSGCMYTFTKGHRTGNPTKHMLLIVSACALLHTPYINVTFLANLNCWPARLSVQCCRYVTRAHVSVTKTYRLLCWTRFCITVADLRH